MEKITLNKIIKFLLIGYFLFFPLGQLLRIPPQSSDYSQIHFYLTDIFVFLIVVVWLVDQKLNINIKNDLLFKPILLFTCWSSVSLLINGIGIPLNQFLIGFLYLFRWIIYAGLYFSLRKTKVFTEEKFVDRLFVGSGLVCALLGLIQYSFLPDTRFLSSYGWDDHYYRLIGTFFDPGYLGMILVLTLITIAYRILISRSSCKVLKITWMIIFIALMLTYSRASYLSFLIVIFLMARFFKNLKFLILILSLFIVSVFLLPRPGGEGVRLERDSTIKFRIINWSQAIYIAKDHLFTGTGFNLYRYARMTYGFNEETTEEGLSHSAAGVDSSLLFVLVTTGLPGLIIYLWLWKQILYRAQPLTQFLGVGLIIHSLFTNTLFYSWILGWWWIFLAFNRKNN